MENMSGVEWIIEAYGCAGTAVRDLARLKALFEDMIRELGLHPVREPMWHQFPVTFGITGLCLLSESHLSCHTFPEYGSLCLNLFCCRKRPEWDFENELKARFGASQVVVRTLERPYQSEGIIAEMRTSAGGGQQ